MEDIRTNSNNPRPASRRRSYPADFKAELVRLTQNSGISVAGIALQHGINPVTVHRWIREARQTPGSNIAAFVPVQLTCDTATRTDANDTAIHIELQRNGTTIRMQWPVAGATQCAAWVREVLK